MSNYHPETSAEIVAEHGLSPDEYEKAVEIMGRAPNLLELGIFSVMWSEHCSYKSSKLWLKTLPTEGPQVIQGPGENAGVVDIGDGQAVIFKIESHNHPSFIEPYQGAATGVGGILRDVFTMGARPVANLNALRFGAPDHPRTKHLVKGVVAGIGGYGNCVGVPTVGGEINFHPAYNGNCLVNAMTVGLADTDKIFYSAASDVGVPVVYVGSKTGRDGIHGATMASTEFDEDSEEKRPTVQVGDPFTEKLLIEACLELMATDAILAIQDMGAAGLTSSSFEMASKGGTGVVLELDQVPMREDGMTPYELMLSESQERMLMTLKPGREAEAQAIFEKWGLDFAVVGTITNTGRMQLKWQGETVGDLPIDPLALASPEYDRPHVATPAQADIAVPQSRDLLADLMTLVASPDLCSRRWVWEQFDHMVMGDTIQRPGGDAAVVRVHGSNKGLAMSVDCSPRYCLADPKAGGAQAVAEGFRNLSAVGAKPLAVTNNLNFGNPEKPQIMGQLVGAVEGMGEACKALDMPVVSGNVSLYNETEGQAILPTPVIGSVGLLADIDRMATVALKRDGDTLVVLGSNGGHLGQSLYARECHGLEAGPAPAIDLAQEAKVGNFVRGLIADGLIDTCHDVSDGGLMVALAEMALAGDRGVSVVSVETSAGFWYGEDQARYLVALPDAAPLQERAKQAGVPLHILAKVEGDTINLPAGQKVALSNLRSQHEGSFPN